MKFIFSYYNIYLIYFNILVICKIKRALGIGDWGLGIGDWGLGPIPNPHILYLITNLIYEKN